MKLNCWEAKQCGRQPGGDKCDELGICPAAIEQKTHGLNNGVNGGRACWAINDTLCGSRVQGGFSQKLGTCLQCDFYSTVRNEESESYKSTKEILAKLN